MRKIIFWLHLVAGVVAGVVIFVMSVTGVALAFEKEIIGWSERDLRRLTVPAATSRLSIDDVLAKVRERQPEGRPSGVTIDANSTVAILVSFGRTNGYYVNPYTGEVRAQPASMTRAFMTKMVEWHRYLGRQENQRPIGKAITGACNAAFCFLALSGIYLWWPRQWTKSSLRAVTLFGRSLKGKARDWNWHNVIGFWSAPVLVILTLTAMPISYRWASDFVYRVTRSTPPPAPGGAGAAGPEVPTPAAGTARLGYDALLASVQREIPQWSQITLRLGGGGPRGGGGATNDRPRNAAAQPVTFAVKQSSGAPRFATAQLSLNPFTGEVLRAEKYSDYNLGRRVRTWSRFLHTGEALGPIGQFIAGLASLGGAILVYTGFALAWRRFIRRKQPAAATPSTPPPAVTATR